MNYLADTHILLWAFTQVSKLSKTIRRILADENNTIYYSPVSLWEISIKYSLSKLNLNGGIPEDFYTELDNSFFRCKSLNNLNIISGYNLPIRHKDPFDRLLIWEAIQNEFILLTVDTKMKLYKNDGLKFVN